VTARPQPSGNAATGAPQQSGKKVHMASEAKMATFGSAWNANLIWKQKGKVLIAIIMAQQQQSCGGWLGRKLLSIINGIFIFIGLGILAGGIYVYVDGLKFGITISVAIGVMVTGAAIALISIMGSYGARFNSPFLLYLYSIIVSGIIIGQIVFLILSYNDKQKLQQGESQLWNSSSNDTKALIQLSFNCCGFWNATDRPSLPCLFSSSTGCYTAITNRIASYMLYVQLAGYIMIGFETILVFCTFLIACDIQQELRKQKKDEQTLRDVREINRMNQS